MRKKLENLRNRKKHIWEGWELNELNVNISLAFQKKNSFPGELYTCEMWQKPMKYTFSTPLHNGKWALPSWLIWRMIRLSNRWGIKSPVVRRCSSRNLIGYFACKPDAMYSRPSVWQYREEAPIYQFICIAFYVNALSDIWSQKGLHYSRLCEKKVETMEHQPCRCSMHQSRDRG